MGATDRTVLVGWKQIAAWLCLDKDTVKRKHRNRPMPISRESDRSQPMVLIADLQEWIRQGRTKKGARK